VKDPFVPGASFINYSGKIYDEREMISLTDAVLDFWLTSGRFTKSFEKELSQYLNVRYVSVTNSGSSANLLAVSALTSMKLGDRRLMFGDEVLTVAAGFPTTIAPIIQNGLVPVFVDVELGTYNVNVDELERAVGPKTKAIILAHTMGNPFNIEAVLGIAKKYNLWLIEDNCDALGSKYNGQYTGTFGDVGTSSFYPPHHITMGEGGAVYTSSPILKVIMESFRDWGRDCWCDSGVDNSCGKRYEWQLGDLPLGYDHKYTYSHLGYNLKATDLQAAVGLEQLKKLNDFTQKRIHNFNRLKENLKELEDVLILPAATMNSEPSWFGFILTIREDGTSHRKTMVKFMEKANIQTRMLFAGNITKQPALKGIKHRLASDLRNTEKIMHDTFLVGVYPGLTDEMIDYMSDIIITFSKEYLL
jgi:CDP-6-deoxy-D-xylo-4-hexulose-3-dehydrase